MHIDPSTGVPHRDDHICNQQCRDLAAADRLMRGSNMRQEIYSDGSSIDPNDISLFGVRGMKYGSVPPMEKVGTPSEETPEDSRISKADALRILEAHIQSDRSKKCKCGWVPTYIPEGRYDLVWTQHRDHLAEMLANGVDI